MITVVILIYIFYNCFLMGVAYEASLKHVSNFTTRDRLSLYIFTFFCGGILALINHLRQNDSSVAFWYELNIVKKFDGLSEKEITDLKGYLEDNSAEKKRILRILKRNNAA